MLPQHWWYSGGRMLKDTLNSHASVSFWERPCACCAAFEGSYKRCYFQCESERGSGGHATAAAPRPPMFAGECERRGEWVNEYDAQVNSSSWKNIRTRTHTHARDRMASFGKLTDYFNRRRSRDELMARRDARRSGSYCCTVAEARYSRNGGILGILCVRVCVLPEISRLLFWRQLVYFVNTLIIMTWHYLKMRWANIKITC